MTKSEILASDLPPVEKVWQIASQRSDIAAGQLGVSVAHDESEHDEFPYSYWEQSCATVCPIGAVLAGHVNEGEDHYDAAAYLLDVTRAWVVGFIDGFDSEPLKSEGHERDGHAAGQENRHRFLEKGVSLG